MHLWYWVYVYRYVFLLFVLFKWTSSIENLFMYMSHFMTYCFHLSMQAFFSWLVLFSCHSWFTVPVHSACLPPILGFHTICLMCNVLGHVVYFLYNIVLVDLNCWNKLPQTGWFTVLEAQEPRSGCQHGQLVEGPLWPNHLLKPPLTITFGG